jgi:hypothetical protein
MLRECEDVDWTHLSQDMDKLQTLAKITTKPWVQRPSVFT